MFTYTDFAYVSFKRILIRLTHIMGAPSSMRILYNTSFLTESQAFLKIFFSRIWQMHKNQTRPTVMIPHNFMYVRT
jgi:hypothetical protein